MRTIFAFLYVLDRKACLIYFVSSVKAKQLIVSCRTVGAISFCSGHQKLYMSVNYAPLPFVISLLGLFRKTDIATIILPCCLHYGGGRG